MLAGTRRTSLHRAVALFLTHMWFAKTLEAQSTGLEIAALVRGGL